MFDVWNFENKKKIEFIASDKTFFLFFLILHCFTIATTLLSISHYSCWAWYGFMVYMLFVTHVQRAQCDYKKSAENDVNIIL